MNGISRRGCSCYAGRMLENRHLRYFVEVAKCLHVTKAAERLHIAQPALTQNIHQLEEELGVELFHREGHRLTLTQAGHVFLKEAQASLLQFDHAQRAAQRAARGEVGKLALGFQSMAGLSVVPHILQRFQSSYPDVEVVLHEMGSAMLTSSLRSGEIDAALFYAVSDDEFASHSLAPEPLVAVLPEDHLLAKHSSIGLKDLAQERFILPLTSEAEVLHHAVFAECAAAGFQPSPVQEVATLIAGLGLIAARFGVSILPVSIEVFGRKGIIFRPIRDSRVTVQLALFWPKENPSPIVTRLLECVDQ
jgi:DNA-binding transcriptional LysR family regulator